MAIAIALAGNPNCGKTTLFNRLTGSNQRVGNWPGVTIDRKSGKLRGVDGAEVVDLPGIYSMSPYSPEERVARDFLMKDRPDAVINIVDATNLERNLFLTMQVLDTGIPTVVALNMMDALEKNGDKIDAAELSKRLGCPVVPISALNGHGVDSLVDRIVEVARAGTATKPVPLGGSIEGAVSTAEDALRGKVPDESLRWHAVKLVENDPELSERFPEEKKSISGPLKALEDELDDECDAIIADARYSHIGEIVGACLTRAPRDERGTRSDRIDRILTHRIWGLPIFIGTLSLVFLFIIGFGDYTLTNGYPLGIGTYFTDIMNDWMERLGGIAEDWCNDNNVSPALTGLLCNGIIGGVGAVIGFLPQMLLLFLILCILEDIGYMARAAFVMDRIFRYFGLSGKSFIPALTGIGCSIPGIMATRTIESERDRRITAMTVPFMPCGAKLPIIAMIAGALFSQNGFVAIFAYVMGIACMLMSGIILKKFRKLAGKPAPFIMELPPYHVPALFTVIKTTLDRGWAFVKKAGSIILIATVLVWFLGSFSCSFEYLGADSIKDSILYAIGNAICGIFVPLGWGDHWELTVGSITGLIAKENIIATFGTIFGIEEIGDSGEEIWDALREYLTPAAGLGFLTFNLFCAPCFAAIGAMHRELGGWKDTALAVGYLCLFAYGLASIVYVVGSLVAGTHVEISGCVVAVIAFVVLAYLLIAKDPFRQLRGLKPEGAGGERFGRQPHRGPGHHRIGGDRRRQGGVRPEDREELRLLRGLLRVLRRLQEGPRDRR